MNGVKGYSIVDINTVKELMPENTTIDKKRLKKQTEKLIKRGIDILVSLLGIVILIPLTIIIYIANLLLKDNGPIFYCQERIGQDGKIFKMYKYRSMVVGAEEKLEQYLEENETAKEEYRKYKKLKNDPRITKIGKFLRKTSLDEFPQFVNVLKSEMSLVGPRPYLPKEKEDMGEYYKDIIKSKPGLTGFWQIYGRSKVPFTERIKMDCDYTNNKNLKCDIKLLMKTFINVVKKEGAL